GPRRANGRGPPGELSYLQPAAGRHPAARRVRGNGRFWMSKVFETRSVEWAPWPVFDEEQIRAVADVLASGRVNQWTGSEVWEFEKEYARYLGRRHAVAVMNGTSALELALKAFGIGPGD